MTSLPRRPIASTGLTTPPLVFGGNVFGWTADAKTSFDLLDACVDHGFDVIDTADVYTRLGGGHGGESETVIGDWLAARGPTMRDRVTLISKCGIEMGEGMKGLGKDYVPRAIEASLKRLRTDRVDLYMMHWDDPETPLEETVVAFDGLRTAGKIRGTGASNYSPDRLRALIAAADAAGVPRIDGFQALYNLYDRAPFEAEIAGICADAGIATFSYFSLASGFLSGKYRPGADLTANKRAMWLERYFDARGETILDALGEVADVLDATPAQVALAWLMAKPALTAVIASATSLRQFEDLAAAVRLDLPTNLIAALDAASKLPTS